MGKKSIIVLSAIAILVISFVVGYLLADRIVESASEDRQISKNINKKENNQALSTVSKDKVVILPTARVKVKQSYKKCGHTVSEELQAPEEIVNMTEDEVKKYYFGWKLEDFSEKNISISKENNGLCEEHYIVRDEDGLITVFRKDDESREILVYSTDVNTKYLPSDDRKRLENGISIVGKENLMALMEDYE